METNNLERMKAEIGKASDDKLIGTISKGILKLSDQQINTISFVFWLVYMAETDLEMLIKSAWSFACHGFSDDVKQGANEILQERYQGSRVVDMNKLDFFLDKIVVLESLYGKDARVKMLYKLHDLRNDISHNRISNLMYEGLSLSERPAKEKIIIDYFETLMAKCDLLEKE